MQINHGIVKTLDTIVFFMDAVGDGTQSQWVKYGEWHSTTSTETSKWEFLMLKFSLQL